jgi:hypothetical protein
VEDWERDEEEDRRQTETFRRIHCLYKRGFRPDWSVTDVEDAIWWQHPGGHPELILYPDGKLVASLESATLNPTAKFDKDRIYNVEKEGVAQFDRWLATVKRPTWWQAGASARERFIIMPIVMVAFYAVMLLFGWGFDRAARAAWHAVFG